MHLKKKNLKHIVPFMEKALWSPEAAGHCTLITITLIDGVFWVED